MENLMLTTDPRLVRKYVKAFEEAPEHVRVAAISAWTSGSTSANAPTADTSTYTSSMDARSIALQTVVSAATTSRDAARYLEIFFRRSNYM